MENRRNDLFRGIGILLAVAMAVCALCFTILAASETVNTVTYDISAKEASIDRKAGVTVFKGDAKIRSSNGDYLNADQVTMYRDVKTNELIRFEAVGNVDMKEKDMTATCQHAILHEKEERIELKGTEDLPAVVDDGRNRMEAPFITYFRKEDRIDAGGNVKGQVTVEVKESEAEEEEAEE